MNAVPPLTDLARDTVGVIALGALLVTAHRHPRARTEAIASVLAGAAVVAVGLVSPDDTWRATRPLLPVVGFLVAILVVSDVCARAGLFEVAAEVVRRRAGHRPGVLFAGVFVLAALTTTVLSLDATVVLLTPVVIHAARRLRDSPRPGAYACLRLANSGSLLLPVSNLTNLLAFPHLDLTFGGYAARMALPLAVVLVIEYVGLRLLLRRDLDPAPDNPAPDNPAADDPAPDNQTPNDQTLPDATPDDTPPQHRRPTGSATDEQPDRRPAFHAVPLVVVAAMLAAFAVLSPAGVEPVWPAAVAAVVLLAWARHRGLVDARAAVRAAHPSFALFVLALGVVVAGLSRGFLGEAVSHLIPVGDDFGDLLLIAVVATTAAAVLTNLSATLLLVPLLAGNDQILAALLGLTIGAGLTWTGSLANLLWRRTLAREGVTPSNTTFHRISLTLTPLALVAATAALAVTR